MALCRETRESIHQIIRISHSSNFYNNKMDCTSWWWRKSDYRIPNDLTKGWNWDRKGWYHRSWDDNLFIRGLEKNTNYTVKLFSRNFVFEGDPTVWNIKTKFEVRNQKWYRDWALSANRFVANLDLLWVVPVLTILSARRIMRFLILSVCTPIMASFFSLSNSYLRVPTYEEAYH